MNVAAPEARCGSASCDAIGRPDLFDHPDYASAEARAKNRKPLNAAIEGELVRKTSAEWVDILNRARRAVRADLSHGPGIRRPPGKTPWGGGRVESPRTRQIPDHQPAGEAFAPRRRS
jgi:hypothetical protein